MGNTNKVKIEKERGVIYAYIKCPDLSGDNIEPIKDEIVNYMLKPHEAVIINMSNVDFIDSRGMRLLITLNRLAKMNRLPFIICEVDSNIIKALNIVKLNDVLNINSRCPNIDPATEEKPGLTKIVGPPTEMVFSIEARFMNIRFLSMSIMMICERIGMPATDIMGTELCIAEICNNIIRHGYGRECSEKLSVKFTKYDNEILFVIKDSAKAFDWKNAIDRAVLIGAPSDKVGGYGLFLISETVDSYSYDRRDGKNILTISKSLVNVEDTMQICIEA